MKKGRPAFPVTFAVAATGVSSITAQLVLVREYFTLFSGNEFVIAMILFTWLVSGALGCFVALAFEKKRPQLRRPLADLGFLSLILTALPPVLLIGVRLLRDLLFVHGSTPGFYPTFAFVLSTLGPYALIHGFALPFALRAARTLDPAYPGFLVFISDNLGDVLGGCLFSFVLVSLVKPVPALALSSVLLFSAGTLLLRREKIRMWLAAPLAAATIVILCLVLETPSLSPPYGTLVHYEESRFGRITVIEDQRQKTLFHDNIPIFSSENLEDAEQTVHYPLSQVVNLESVLLVSWKSGVTGEIARYRPQIVDLVEIDPAITRTLSRFRLIDRIPGLNLAHTDARTFLSETDKTYDAIILNVSDPETFQTNRFFTREFFRSAKQHLRSGGVLSFSMKGYDSYLAETERQKLACLYRTAADVFAQVLAVPGTTVTFVCSDQGLNWDIPALLTKKGIDTRTLHGLFYGNVSALRVEQLRSMLTQGKRPPLNTDLRPVLMTRQFADWFSRHGSSPLPFFMVAVLILVLYTSQLNRKTAVLFTTGFSLMASEILVIFAFQIFFGHIYHHIGIIVTFFMAGLLPGAVLAGKTKARQALAASDFMIIICLAVFALLVQIRADRLFFMVLGFPFSLLCGFQFAHILQVGDDKESIFGRAFSADLAGAGFGVLAASLILIPGAGLLGSILCLMALKGLSLALSFYSGNRS